MKRKGLTFCMAVMMAGMLTACATGQNQETTGDAEPTVTAEPTEAPQPTAEAEPSGEEVTPTIAVEISAGNDDIDAQGGQMENIDIPQAYLPILQEYQTMITEKWDNGKTFDEGLCTIISGYGEYTTDQIGYCLYDLNFDGEPELLIGPTEEDKDFGSMIYDAYTIQDGQAKQLFVSQERNRYYLIEDEAGAVLIANEGSNGAASSCWFYYNMLDDLKLHMVQGIIYDGSYDSENPWFSVYEGWDPEEWDLSQAEPTDSQLASDIVDAHVSSYAAIDFTALSTID